MKKYVILFLTVILLFTSCTIPTPNTTRSPNVFSVDSLPDIGSFSGVSSDKRFYDEPVYDFIPSDEYGMVIPYIGTYRLFETPKEEGSDWHAEQGYASYGFCTADGRIVMDASDKNSYVNYRETDDGFGYYTLTREVHPKEDSPDEYIPGETYVIPLDGSWCLKLPQGSWVSNSGGGYIGICDYSDNEMVKVRMYNYDGELVRTIEGSDSTGVFSNGLMLVSRWTDNGYSADFVNEDGEKVLGPYSSASDFNKYGITAVKDEDGAYLVNTKGERLTGYYDSFYKEYSDDMSNHVFTARHSDDNKKSDIYSDKGVLLGTAEGSSYYSFRFLDDGRILYYYTYYDVNDKGYADYSTERMIWRFLDSGENFVSEELGVSPNSYSGTDNCFVYNDKTNKKGYLIDTEGKTVAVLDGASEVLDTTENGEYAIFIEGEYDYSFDEETGKPDLDTRKTHIYDSKKAEIVYTIGAYSYAHFSDKNKRFALLTTYEAEDMYDIMGGDPKYTLFDAQSGKVVFENCLNISIYEIGESTYINVCTDNSSALYDGNLKLVRKEYFE